MPRGTFDRIKAAIREGRYDMTVHAVDEMAEDGLDTLDVESSILRGKVKKTDKDDPRGPRHTIYGTGTDHKTRVSTVGRLTETGRYLIITVYKLTET
jgi:hypothetical protein